MSKTVSLSTYSGSDLLRMAGIVMIATLCLAATEWLGWWYYPRSLATQWWVLWQRPAVWSWQVAAQPLSWLHTARQRTMVIQDLERKNAELLSQVGEVERFRAENQELRELLRIDATASAHPQLRTTLSSLARPKIGVGAREGMVSGRAVTVGGVMIGTLGEVSEFDSQLVPLDSTKPYALLARTQSGASGVVVGTGKRIELREISRDTLPLVGEKVLTTGSLTGTVPRDLVIGTVERVIDQPTAGSLTVILQPGADWYKARFVEIF
jgi:cell shape-determining protein MreC